MRKALIAVITASALFAVGAFAAEFAVDSEQLATGDANVQGCATAADVTFNVGPTIDTSSQDFEVTTVSIAFTERSANSCLNAEVDLAIGLDVTPDDGTADSWVDATNCSAVSAAASSCDVTTFVVPVGQVEEVVVLANGILVQDTDTDTAS